MSSNSLISDGKAYCVRLIETGDTKASRAYQRLRFEYFVRQRQWIAPEAEHSSLESDCYDSFAHHLGIFQGGVLVAYLRALPWHTEIGFMLEHDFHCLISDEASAALHRKQSWEISRLVLAPSLPADAVLRVTELLFKLLYQSCRQHKVEHLYAVVEPGWLRRFQRCFHLPFQALGAAQRFPDGTRAVAAYARISDLEHSLLAVNPLKLDWYRDE